MLLRSGVRMYPSWAVSAKLDVLGGDSPASPMHSGANDSARDTSGGADAPTRPGSGTSAAIATMPRAGIHPTLRASRRSVLRSAPSSLSMSRPVLLGSRMSSSRLSLERRRVEDLVRVHLLRDDSGWVHVELGAEPTGHRPSGSHVAAGREVPVEEVEDDRRAVAVVRV